MAQSYRLSSWSDGGLHSALPPLKTRKRLCKLDTFSPCVVPLLRLPAHELRWNLVSVKPLVQLKKPDARVMRVLLRVLVLSCVLAGFSSLTSGNWDHLLSISLGLLE